MERVNLSSCRGRPFSLPTFFGLVLLLLSSLSVAQTAKRKGIRLTFGPYGQYETGKRSFSLNGGLDSFRSALLNVPVVVPLGNPNDTRGISSHRSGPGVRAQLSFGNALTLSGATLFPTSNGESVALIGHVEAIYPAKKELYRIANTNAVAIRIRSSLSKELRSFNNASYTGLPNERATLGLVRKDLLLTAQFSGVMSKGSEHFGGAYMGKGTTKGTFQVKIGPAHVCQTFDVSSSEQWPKTQDLFSNRIGPQGRSLYSGNACGLVLVVDPSVVFSFVQPDSVSKLEVGNEFLIGPDRGGYGKSSTLYIDFGTDFILGKLGKITTGFRYSIGKYNYQDPFNNSSRSFNSEFAELKLGLDIHTLFKKRKKRKDRLGIRR